MAENTHNLKPVHGWFINLTDTIVPENVRSLLAMRPKFSFKYTRNEFSPFNVISDVENLAKSIPSEELKPIFRGKASTTLSNHIHKLDSAATPEDKHIPKLFKETKKFMKENKSIVVLKAEKGKTTIQMNKDEYTAYYKTRENTPKFEMHKSGSGYKKVYQRY